MPTFLLPFFTFLFSLVPNDFSVEMGRLNVGFGLMRSAQEQHVSIISGGLKRGAFQKKERR